MTTAISINILLAATVFIAIIGMISWSILSSRQPRTDSLKPARTRLQPATDRRRQSARGRLQSEA